MFYYSILILMIHAPRKHNSMLYTATIKRLVHPRSVKSKGAKTGERASYEDAVDDVHALQLFRQYPGEVSVPTI